MVSTPAIGTIYMTLIQSQNERNLRYFPIKKYIQAL